MTSSLRAEVERRLHAAAKSQAGHDATPVTPKAAMTSDDVQRMADATVVALRAMIDRTLAEKRFMFFEGPYIAGHKYKRGAVTQRREALWVAMTETEKEPGGPGVVEWRRLGDSR